VVSDVIVAAAEADAVILLVGYRFNDEGEYVIPDPSKEGTRAKEGGDRESLTLKPEDEKRISEIASENNKSVVVLVGGSAVIMESWKNQVPAILMSWYPGMEGGTALANILFGEVNPSGKLPFTIPSQKEHLPLFDPFAKKVEYGYYHGYTLLEKEQIEPAFPFGFGMSYTQYYYDSLSIEDPNLSGSELLVAEVNVTNAGRVAGEEVVQLYVGFENSSVDRPVKLLRGFQKIGLKPGETKKVTFKVSPEDLLWYNPETHLWELEKMEYSLYIGSSSSREDLLSAQFRCTE
jgi:beta-glucosidase